MNESTVRTFKAKYEREKKAARIEKRQPLQKICSQPRERPTMLGPIDEMVQSYLKVCILYIISFFILKMHDSIGRFVETSGEYKRTDINECLQLFFWGVRNRDGVVSKVIANTTAAALIKRHPEFNLSHISRKINRGGKVYLNQWVLIEERPRRGKFQFLKKFTRR